MRTPHLCGSTCPCSSVGWYWTISGRAGFGFLRSPDRERGDMDRTTDGWGSGLLGVIIFSGSLPATRVVVGDFSPLFLTSARAVIAALLGAAFLVVLRQVRPRRGDLGSLAVVALGRSEERRVG